MDLTHEIWIAIFVLHRVCAKKNERALEGFIELIFWLIRPLATCSQSVRAYSDFSAASLQLTLNERKQISMPHL